MTQRDQDIIKMRRALEVVTGWREYDWPEGFDRRTAELIANRVRMEVNPLAELQRLGQEYDKESRGLDG